MKRQLWPVFCFLLGMVLSSIVSHYSRWPHLDLRSRTNKERKRLSLSVFILTSFKNWPTKGTAVNSTWAKHFDHYFFVYSNTTQTNISPGLAVNLPDGRYSLTQKTVRGFLYMYHHFLNVSQWFMKADDDTYVIVEKLRRFLEEYDSTLPIVFGYRFWHLTKPNYLPYGLVSGGAGYVLSREALRLFVEKGVKKSFCPLVAGNEDERVSACLTKLGVKFGNTLDKHGNQRFHPYQHPVKLKHQNRRKSYVGFPKSDGPLSADSLTFHYVDPASMFLYEFLTYDLAPERCSHN